MSGTRPPCFVIVHHGGHRAPQCPSHAAVRGGRSAGQTNRHQDGRGLARGGARWWCGQPTTVGVQRWSLRTRPNPKRRVDNRGRAGGGWGRGSCPQDCCPPPERASVPATPAGWLGRAVVTISTGNLAQDRGDGPQSSKTLYSRIHPEDSSHLGFRRPVVRPHWTCCQRSARGTERVVLPLAHASSPPVLRATSSASHGVARHRRRRARADRPRRDRRRRPPPPPPLNRGRSPLPFVFPIFCLRPSPPAARSLCSRPIPPVGTPPPPSPM